MAKKKTVTTNAMRILQRSVIEYTATEYECSEVGADFGEEIARLTGIAPERSFKTLVVKGDKSGTMVACIPVALEIDFKKLAKLSDNKNVEMIHTKELFSLTGYIRGGVSPIGMKKKYPTYIDNSCFLYKKVAISAGICGCTLELSPTDLIKICNAFTGSITREKSNN